MIRCTFCAAGGACGTIIVGNLNGTIKSGDICDPCYARMADYWTSPRWFTDNHGNPHLIQDLIYQRTLYQKRP